MNASACLVLLIAGTTVIRLVFAAATGLGVDESYMVSAGRVLSLGYFDHPPAAWWLSWGAAHVAGTETPVVVRLPFILLFACSTWLMARLTTLIAGEKAGVWAALLLNLSPVFGITTGTWVLPDGPLDCALLGAALCLVHALPARGGPAWRWWCTAGVCAGLALFSKYSAGLSIAGALVFLVVSRIGRHWLRRPEPYVAGLLALAVFAPVLVWNAAHGWASFAFQGQRAVGLRFHPLAPLVTLAGEALFVLPWFWVPMMGLAVLVGIRNFSPSPCGRGLRGGGGRRLPVALALHRAEPPPPNPLPQGEGESWGLLVWLAAPPILAFALISAWSSQRVLFHWAAPGYLMLFPLLGQWAAECAHRRWLRRTVIGTAALVLAAVTIIGTQTRFDWLGPALADFTRKDPTIEGIDWVSLRTDLTARGLALPGLTVGVPNWRDAGKIAHALGPSVTVLCLSPDARQFGFADPPAAHIGQDILLLIPDHADRVVAGLARNFERIDPLPPISVRLGDRVLQNVAVYQGHHLLAWP